MTMPSRQNAEASGYSPGPFLRTPRLDAGLVCGPFSETGASMVALQSTRTREPWKSSPSQHTRAPRQ